MKRSVGSIMRGKKLRYGSTAAAFTVAFVAIVIVVNVIFTAFAEKYRWYIDMTGDEIFSLSDATKEALADVTAPVTITFCMDKDKIDEDHSMFYIHNTAQNLAAEFKNITIEYRDVLRDVEYLESHYTSLMSPNVFERNVIVSSGTEYRKLAYNRFFITDTEDTSNVWAYQGENIFASSILQVTADELPIAYFTTQHGEDTEQSDDAGAFKAIVEEAGYEVVNIDLSKEEIDPAGRLIIINNPKTDFGGINDPHIGKSEIEKIDEFLDGRGSMMVFVSPDNAGKLTNLSEFLEEWGVKFNPDVVVSDPGNSVTQDNYSVVGQYITGEENLSSSIYKEITSMSSQPKAIFRQAMPLSRTWDTDTYTTPDLGRRTISDVFVTSPSALLNEGGTLNSAEDTYSLMTITQEYKIIDNEDYTNYVIVGGTPKFTASEYIYSNVFTNRGVVQSCLITLGKKDVPAGIQYKVFEDYDLDITTAQADTWTRILILVMPICTVIVCVVVTVRRKYK